MRCNTVGLNPGTNSKEVNKFQLVLEDCIITFLVVLIPKLIALGGPPKSLVDLWEPLLSSMLMALYSYMRLRGMEKPSS